MDRLLNILTEIASNMENEGEALKDYQSFLNMICNFIECKKSRLQESDDYEKNNPKPVDSEMAWTPYMSDDEKQECRDAIAAAIEIKKSIQEIIADEMNHSLVLTGLLVKFGKTRPSTDNLAQAVAQILAPTDEEDGNDN